METDHLFTDFILKLKSYLEKDSSYSHKIKIPQSDSRSYTSSVHNICHYFIENIYIFSILTEFRDPLKAYIYINHFNRLKDFSVTLDRVHNLEEIKDHVHNLYLLSIRNKLLNSHEKQLELENKLILMS